MDKTATVTSAGSSFQTIAVLVLFVALMALLPWLLRRWQQRQMQARGEQGVQTQLLSTMALSPAQRIVVVEVGQGAQRTRLVLGVTAQNIQCLHVLPASIPPADSGTDSTFAGAMVRVQTDMPPPPGVAPH